jgi:hypothetical protein
VVAAVIAASGFLGYGVVDAWQEHRSRGQLPPRPGQNGRGLEGGRAGSTGHDPALPRARPDQTRVDLRTHRPGRDRRHRSGRVRGRHAVHDSYRAPYNRSPPPLLCPTVRVSLWKPRAEMSA